VQNIPNPASVKAQNALQNEQVKSQFLKKKLTEKQLTLQVKQTYLELQQRKELNLRTVFSNGRYSGGNW